DCAGAAMAEKYDNLKPGSIRRNRSDPSDKFIDSFPTKRKRAAPQLEIAARALAAIFPDKLPDQATLPNRYLIRRVREQFEKDGVTRPIHDDSILRAAGRK